MIRRSGGQVHPQRLNVRLVLAMDLLFFLMTGDRDIHDEPAAVEVEGYRTSKRIMKVRSKDNNLLFHSTRASSCTPLSNVILSLAVNEIKSRARKCKGACYDSTVL